MSQLFERGTPLPIEMPLEKAKLENKTWDVFVSHQRNDKDTADMIAECMKSHGLSAWVADYRSFFEGSGPELDKYIQSILERSFSLIVVISKITEQSWWVPFEIGVAFNLRRYLASFILDPVDLPLFLKKHPQLYKHDPDLENWCAEIKSLLDRNRNVLLNEAERVTAHYSQEFFSTMERLTSEFSNPNA